MGEVTVFGAGGKPAQSSAAPARPVESPDSLQALATARVLMLMGMGQHAGPPASLAQCVYLDGVPLENADGSRNFERVVVEWRPGTQHQDRIAGFSDVETEVSVAAEVKAAAPLVRLIDDVTATAVRVTVSTAALLSIDANGNTNPTAVSLAVDIKPAVGAWAEVGRIDISGKTRSRYPKARRFALAGAGPWQVRVRRITPDSATQNLQNATSWDGYTVINETPLRYPNSALLALKFDAKAFSSMPKIEARWRLNLLQVPSNYDAASRSYSGPWDGTFKPAVSNNPAWWLYTYLTDSRFNIGLPDGEYKWDLYRIAQWCDQLVSDGQGGLRPRFAANMVQTETADPWAIVQDIASIFCGRVIPYAGGVRVVADMPSLSQRKHFVPANVEGGRFVYGDSELKDRHTSAVVTFRDKTDRHQNAVELVEHADGYLRYGHNPVDVVGVGIDNRAQAQQLGRYVLETAQAETGTVSFGAGIYALDLLPGDVFEIADPVEAGARYGGRLMSVDGTAVVLDAPVELLAGAAYSLEVPLPDGTLQRRGVAMQPGSYTALQLVAPFSQQPVEGTTWLLVATTVQPTLWRCVSNAQVGGDPFHRAIAGVQHDPGKWDRIERGIRLVPLPVSSLPDPSSPPAVAGVVVREVDYLRPDGVRAVRLDVDWPASSFAFLRGYVVSYRQAAGNWVELPESSANHAEIADVLPGQWQVRVAAVSVTGARSVSAPLDVTAAGSTRKPSLPVLTAAGGAMRVDLAIGWPSVDCVRAELFGSASASDPAPAKLCDLAYPASTWAHLGMATGVTMHYWLRVYSSWGVASDFVRASATTVKDPSILLQQLQGSVSREALDGLLRTDIVTAQDMATRVIPALNDAAEQAAKAGIAALIEADRRRREARFNRRAFDAILDIDPATGQIKLKATAEITTDVDTKLRDVQLVLDAQAGKLATAVSGIESQGGRLTTAESKLTQLETGISLAVQQAFAYTDGAVASNGEAVGDLQQQVDTLAGSGIAGLVADQRRQQQARAVKLGLSRAQFDIKAVADGLASEATARLALDAQLGSTAAALLVEQKARADGDAAVSQQVSTLAANLQTEKGARLAAIEQEATARATADGALASRIDTVQAAVDEASAAVQQEAIARADAVSGVLGKWSVRIVTTADGQQRVAGIGLLSGQQGSAFSVLADAFTVALPNGAAPKQVFTVGSINGGPAVGISGDLVLDGSITGRALSVDRLSSLSSDLGVVTAGKLNLIGVGADWSYVKSGGKFWGDGANGWILARHPNGDTFLDFKGGSSQLRLSSWGDCLLQFGDAITLRGDGYARVRRLDVVDDPTPIAAATAFVNSGELDGQSDWVYMIDTGINAQAHWAYASSHMYAASATIANGRSTSGGAAGYAEATVVIGDTLEQWGHGVIDGRIYIRYCWRGSRTPSGSMCITAITWKLARV